MKEQITNLNNANTTEIKEVRDALNKIQEEVGYKVFWFCSNAS